MITIPVTFSLFSSRRLLSPFGPLASLVLFSCLILGNLLLHPGLLSLSSFVCSFLFYSSTSHLAAIRFSLLHTTTTPPPPYSAHSFFVFTDSHKQVLGFPSHHPPFHAFTPQLHTFFFTPGSISTPHPPSSLSLSLFLVLSEHTATSSSPVLARSAPAPLSLD